MAKKIDPEPTGDVDLTKERPPEPPLLPDDRREPYPELVEEPEPPELHQALPELPPHEDPAHEDYVEVTAYATRSGKPLTIDEVGDVGSSPEVERVGGIEE